MDSGGKEVDQDGQNVGVTNASETSSSGIQAVGEQAEQTKPLEVIDIRDLQREEGELGRGRHHLVVPVRMGNTEYAFRMLLDSTDAAAREQSKSEVTGSIEAAKKLEKVNQRLVKTGNPVQFSNTVQRFVVENKGQYRGSLSEIFDLEGWTTVYPYETYNSGHANEFKLLISRWEELAGEGSIDTLNTRIGKYDQDDE